MVLIIEVQILDAEVVDCLKDKAQFSRYINDV